MSSNESPNAPATPQPTEKQTRLLAIVMQSVKSKPDIDWDNVVKLSGSKTVASAKEQYRVLQKKLGFNSPSNGTGASDNTLATPTKVTKRTGKFGSKAAPKSGGKGRGKKAVKQEEEEEEEEDGGEDGTVGPNGKYHKASVEDDSSEGV